MELTKVQEKIKKESRTAFIIAIILGYFSAASFAMMTLLVVVTAISPGDLHPSPETAVADLVNAIAPYMFNCAFVSVVSYFAFRIFHEVNSSYTPFSLKNTKRLKIISHSMGAMAIALVLYSFIYGFDATFGDGFRIQIDFGFSIAFATTYVIMGIMFELLARIFEYGRLLQQESDETL